MWSRCLLLAWVCSVSVPGQQPAAPDGPKEFAVLEGRVLGAEGVSLRKVTLRLEPQSGKPGEVPLAYRATSDAEGKFIFDGVEPGRYMLSGSRSGYLSSTYGSKKEPYAGTVLTLMAGQRMKRIDFSLVPQSIISGKVIDDDGDPVVGLQVELLDISNVNGKRLVSPIYRTQTNTTGEFQCANLTAGRYSVLATPAKDERSGNIRKTRAQATLEELGEERIPVPTYYPGVTDEASAELLEVGAGRTLANVEIRLRRSTGFSIKGTVAGSLPTGNGPRPEIVLTRLGEDLRGAFTAMVDQDGAFELKGVPSGSYELNAFAPNGRILARRRINVGDRNLESISLLVQPVATLKGSIKLETAAAHGNIDYSQVQIGLYSDETGDLTPLYSQNGSFTFDNVSRGKYKVSVFNHLEGFYVKSARLGGGDVPVGGLDFAGGASEGPLEIVLSDAGAEIDGLVHNDQHQPVSAALVLLTPDTGDNRQSIQDKISQTDQNGVFFMKGVAPGHYRIYALENFEAWTRLDPDSKRNLEGLGMKITVEEHGKERVTLVRVTPEQAQKLR